MLAPSPLTGHVAGRRLHERSRATAGIFSTFVGPMAMITHVPNWLAVTMLIAAIGGVVIYATIFKKKWPPTGLK